jgi:hypothetical protein
VNCTRLHGQTSLEFLYTLGFMMLFFSAILGIFLLAQSDLDEVGWRSESRALCHSASSQVSSLIAAGEGTSISLYLPLLSSMYSARASGPERSILVNGTNRLTVCSLTTSNITNGTSAVFPIVDGMRATYSNGGVTFG